MSSRGRLVVSNPAPAAGANLAFVVPAGKRWRPLAFRGRLTTSATVANRIAHLTADDGANFFLDVGSAFTQVASTIVDYSGGPGIPDQVNAAIGAAPIQRVILSIPVGLELPAGGRLSCFFENLQAADAWSVTFLLAEEWDG